MSTIQTTINFGL